MGAPIGKYGECFSMAVFIGWTLLSAAIIGIGGLGFYLGRRTGFKEGHAEGLTAGETTGTVRKGIRAG
tara:strand:+ start:536 stop:739 length:204 start_codon:yes stop_codon:yes gene_type:complete